jgi:molecular chaperone DnaK (HSP70)
VQRDAIMEAAKIAKLNVLRILNEPIAATIAHGLHQSQTESSRVLVFDFGVQTLDVSLLDYNNGIFKVMASAVDTHLGRDDLLDILVQDCVQDFEF